jgi:hypothetical protein
MPFHVLAHRDFQVDLQHWREGSVADEKRGTMDLRSHVGEGKAPLCGAGRDD